MKSQLHPRILGWLLRPLPSGNRRYVIGYLCVAGAAAVSTMIILGFGYAARHCTAAGFGCLSLFVRGIIVATAAGAAVLIGTAIYTKLGGLFIALVIALSLLLLAVAALLGQVSAVVEPFVAVGLLGVPAFAAWCTRPTAQS